MLRQCLVYMGTPQAAPGFHLDSLKKLILLTEDDILTIHKEQGNHLLEIIVKIKLWKKTTNWAGWGNIEKWNNKVLALTV